MPCQTNLQEIVKCVEGSIILSWCGDDSFMNDVKEKCCSTEQISGKLLYTAHSTAHIPQMFQALLSLSPASNSNILLSHKLFKNIKKGQHNEQLKCNKWRENN